MRMRLAFCDKKVGPTNLEVGPTNLQVGPTLLFYVFPARLPCARDSAVPFLSLCPLLLEPGQVHRVATGS